MSLYASIVEGFMPPDFRAELKRVLRQRRALALDDLRPVRAGARRVARSNGSA